MNKKFKNILILSAMLIVFVAVTFIFSSDRAIKHPDYTVYSANDKGAALLYDSLKILNFPVDISTMYIDEKTSVNDIHIIIAPNYNDFSEDRMKKISDWVMRGGNLIFLDSNNYFFSYSLESYFKNSEVYHTNTFSYYIYGAGKAYFSSALPVTNKTLMDTPSNGEVIPEVISNMYYEKIYFNESYHGYAPSERLWDNTPFNIKLVAYEIIIVTIVSVIYFGKRFGPYQGLPHCAQNSILQRIKPALKVWHRLVHCQIKAKKLYLNIESR